jgi:hypothetical protein
VAGVKSVRWDAKTIGAVAGLCGVLMQGGEARLATARVEAKVDRLEERVARIEQEVSPRFVSNSEE